MHLTMAISSTKNFMQLYLKKLPSSNLNSPQKIKKLPPKKKAMGKEWCPWLYDSAPAVGPVL